jgi:hypothetical protein
LLPMSAGFIFILDLYSECHFLTGCLPHETYAQQ